MSAARVPVLMYHRIGTAHNAWERKYCVSPQRFAEHMQALANAGWSAVSIHDFFGWLDGKRELPEQSFLLTFDDGFLGIFTDAAPTLEKLKWPATVFLVTALTGQRDVWCAEHNPSGATYPLLDASHIHELRGRNFSFQSHTRDHADLPTLGDVELREQLSGAREDLAALLGEAPPYLAYPYGRHDERVLQAARAAGYLAAFSVQPGFNRRDIDRFRLRRLDVFGTDSSAALRRKIELGSNDGSLRNHVRYKYERLRARLTTARSSGAPPA